jgi:hypothetical protein
MPRLLGSDFLLSFTISRSNDDLTRQAHARFLGFCAKRHGLTKIIADGHHRLGAGKYGLWRYESF